MTIMESAKKGLKRLAIGTVIIYAAGAIANYVFRDNVMESEELSLKNKQVNALLKEDKDTYNTLEAQVNALEKEQNGLIGESLAWPYTAGKAAYNLGDKIF